MTWGWWLATAVGLAMDATAAAAAASLDLCRVSGRTILRVAGVFGIFQAGMFAAGVLGGGILHAVVVDAAPWVAAALLAGVGLHMLWAAFRRGPAKPGVLAGWALWLVAVATSLDALLVGLGYSLAGEGWLGAAFLIGGVTVVLAAAGMVLGCRLGPVLGRSCGAAGGLILLLLAVKVLWVRG